MSYFNYSIFKKDYTYFSKALALAKTMPEDTRFQKIIEVVEGK